MKREDLQGIRGFAIVSVLAFHYFPNVFPNGFVGVDVFFVLSGFLMTMIFGSKSITWNTVNMFYYRRIKRILPLYLLIILIGSLSIFIIFSQSFLSINLKSAWQAMFLYKNLGGWQANENFHFKMVNQADDIFTHTWSLCVQMQFYLLAPLIFWIHSKLPIDHSQKISLYYHLTLITLSLSYQLLSTENVAFNSVFSRLWQFLLGSGAFFLSEWLLEFDRMEPEPSESMGLLGSGLWEEDLLERADEIVIFRKPKAPRQNLDRYQLNLLLSLSIFALIGLSFFTFGIQSQVLRVLVTFLTALIIVAGTFCEENLMKHRYLVYLGDISYSLYLIHWPIYTYVKHFYENQYGIYFFAIFLSLSSAILLSETFEKWYLGLGEKGFYALITGFSILIVALVLGQNTIFDMVNDIRYSSDKIVYQKYLKSPENLTLEETIIINRKWAREEYKSLIIPNCLPNDSEHRHCEFDRSGLSGTLKVFIIGNSYAPNLAPLVYKTFGKYAKTMEMYSWPRCETLVLDRSDTFNSCKKPNARYLEEVANYHPDILFILERPVALFHPVHEPIEQDPLFIEAQQTLEKYQKLVKTKIFLAEAISPPVNPTLSKYADLLEKGVNVTVEADLTYRNAVRRQKELIKRCSKCQLIPISHILHEKTFTRKFDTKTKLGYFYDGLHLTPPGLQLVLPVFQNVSDSFNL